MPGDNARHGRWRRDVCGTAAVELALVFPALLILIALIIDVGRLLADVHAVSKSVRGAAGYLSRIDAGPGALAIDCAAGSFDAGVPQVGDAIRLAMTGRIDGDPARHPLVKGWTASALSEAETGVRVRVECADSTAAVTVSASVPFRFGPARLVGLGPTTRFTIERRMAHTGP